MNTYWNPVRTREGRGSLRDLPDILREMQLASDKVLLISFSDEMLEKDAFQSLTEFEVQKYIFTASNPTVEQLFAVYQDTKDFLPDAVVAVGGGTILDIGKSLCCLYGETLQDADELRDYIAGKKQKIPCSRWIGVPTTAGTGSEVTCWATIWDPSRNVKRSLENHRNFAYAAVVDSELTQGMPVKLAVSSALDACAHAVESYWANHTNMTSRALALSAVRTIMNGLDDLLLGKPEGHEAMAQGSLLAGLAFSNTKTTACHSISYPLTMKYRIPHGTAVSMLLGPVCEMNAPVVQGMGALYDALGVKDARELGTRVKKYLAASGQSTCLKDWGVKKEDLAELAGSGMTKGRADNNPVALTEERIEKILMQIFE